MIKLLSHFEFIFLCRNFVYDVKTFSEFADLHTAVQVSRHHLLRRLFPILYSCLLSCLLCWRLIGCRYVRSFPGHSILFHWSLCLFLCQHHSVLTTVALQCCHKPGRVMPWGVFFFLLRIALAVLGLLWFHTNCEIIYSSSVKNAMGNLRSHLIFRLLWVHVCWVASVMSNSVQFHGL